MEEDRRGEVGLFRYALIRDAGDPALSKAERGARVRALAGVEHVGPEAQPAAEEAIDHDDIDEEGPRT